MQIVKAVFVKESILCQPGFQAWDLFLSGDRDVLPMATFFVVENELHVEGDVDDDVEDDVGVWVEVDDEVPLHVSLL